MPTATERSTTTYWLRTDPHALIAWHGCTKDDARKLKDEGWALLDEAAYRVLVRRG